MSSETHNGTAGLVAALWDRQSRWSQAANQAKAAVYRSRVLSLALIAAAAVLAALSPTAFEFDETLGAAVAVASAACLALMPIVGRGARPSRVQRWTRLRSVSEALKSEVYTYLAHAEPYQDSRRDETLKRRTDALLALGKDLAVRVEEIVAVRRIPPAIHDVASYIDIRLTPQIDGYYRKQAKIMGRRAGYAEAAQWLLAVAAATLGVVASYLGVEATIWLAVVATVSGAISAHAAANRYTLQELEYLRTAQQLKHLLEVSNRDTLVVESERVISIQNEGWMAQVVQQSADS